jgi:hypothetical protein
VADYGEEKKAYNPMYIDFLDDSELAFIKSADNLIIFSVNNERKVSPFKVTMGKGLDSIKIREGNHRISAWLGVDINIGKVFYKAGHTYFIDYAKKGDYVHYWVKDLTDNKIVYGKEIK